MTRLFLALLPVLNTLDLVKKQEDISRPNFIARWRGSFSSPASSPHPLWSPSALFWAERSIFLVKPHNGKAELSVNPGANPHTSSQGWTSGVRALADGFCRVWVTMAMGAQLRGETEAAAEHLFHLPKPHLISQESHSLRNPGGLSQPGGHPWSPPGAQHCSPWVTKQTAGASSKAGPTPPRPSPAARFGGPRLPPMSGQLGA